MTGRFRLTMATQEGEKLARQQGFTCFPVSPFVIARNHQILIEKKPPDIKGISGALIFAEPNPIIIYSTEHENEGFENFSVSHELGHYFLPGHPEQILSSGGTHMSRSGFSEGASSIELEADHFASGLLMPDYLVRRSLGSGQIGLKGVSAMADEAKTSLTAAAIRAAELAHYPMCVIISEGQLVRYAFPSPSFKDLGRNIYLRKGSPVASNSATCRFNRDPANVLTARELTGECRLSDWFDEERQLRLDEEVVGLGKYGLTLTILSSEEFIVTLDDEEDEVSLEESWTPKFAYGR